MLKRPGNILFFTILLALFLRLGGITHGFPYIFHPDEPTIVRSALGIRFDANPGHFDWPHLYIYFNYFVYMGFAYLRNLTASLNFKPAISAVLPIIWNDSLIFYLITRIISAIFGALTLIPIYLTGKRLFNEKVGLLAAFGYATFPYQVWWSHYTMPDTAMVFLLSWGIYYCAKILTEKDYANYVFAGFFFGLSASTKYNGILGIILIPLAHLLAPGYSRAVKDINGRKFKFFETLIMFVAAALSSVLGFVIGTPYAAVDYKTFIRTDGPKGALWQFTNVGALDVLKNIDLIINRIFISVGGHVGYVVMLGMVVIAIYIVYRFLTGTNNEYDYASLLLLIPLVFLLVYVASRQKDSAQYYFVVYPYLAILYGYFINLVFVLVRRRSAVASFMTLGVLIFITLYFSSIVTLRYINNDTRLDLVLWGKSHLNSGDRVLYDSVDLKSTIPEITHNYQNVSKIAPGETYDYYISTEGKNPGNTYVQIYNIGNNLRLGPEISVYKKVI